MESDKQPLPPLPKKLDGEHEETELSFNKCKHVLEIVSSVEVRCKKCGVFWSGPEVYKLVTEAT